MAFLEGLGKNITVGENLGWVRTDGQLPKYIDSSAVTADGVGDPE